MIACPCIGLFPPVLLPRCGSPATLRPPALSNRRNADETARPDGALTQAFLELITACA
jgi:hypothetical protein